MLVGFNPGLRGPPLIAALSISPEVAMSTSWSRGAWLAASGALALFTALGSIPATAFCGFYVGKADAKLFNEASQVILVRDGNRTVISMRNDFQGGSVRIRAGRTRACRAPKEPDPCRRPEDLRPDRCLQRTAACRILRSQSVRSRQGRAPDERCGTPPRRWRGRTRRRRRTRRLVSPSKHDTRSGSTTSRFFRRRSRMDWKSGCVRAATTSPPRRARRCSPTSART